jgi:hypothetical protein
MQFLHGQDIEAVPFTPSAAGRNTLGVPSLGDLVPTQPLPAQLLCFNKQVFLPGYTRKGFERPVKEGAQALLLPFEPGYTCLGGRTQPQRAGLITGGPMPLTIGLHTTGKGRVLVTQL